MKWHKLTTKAFTEKLVKALELQAQQPGITELGGFFVLFNYEIDEQALAKAKKNGGAAYESEDSKSGASLNIQVMQKVAPFTDLYDLTEYLVFKNNGIRKHKLITTLFTLYKLFALANCFLTKR